ncbi:MAG: GAF domain-containing protein [Chroococcidiopsidaceae cyanobacterium CP_BM_ER_R8_30]|nr:GAF domain-containing protein [Chroococcidiopsidaceae cyanobacterium CP_BM_ER_R8_30]
MISSPEPNKATHQVTPDEQFFSQIISDQQQIQSIDKKEHQESDIENLFVHGQMLTNRQAHSPRWWQRLSLRVKTTALAVALSTIPVLAIGATTYVLANRKITQDTFNQQTSQALYIANTLDRFTIERYRDIQTLSQLRIFNDPRVRAATSVQEKEAALTQFMSNKEGYYTIAVADLSGRLLVGAGTGKIPANFSKIDYFKAVLKTNRPVITPPRESVIPRQGYCIFVAAPIIDPVTGKTIGVVRTQTLVRSLSGTFELEAKALGRGIQGSISYADLVLNQNGKVVVSTPTNYTNLDIQSIFPHAAQLKATDKVGSTVDFSQLDRKDYIVSYAPAGRLPGAAGLNWSAVVIQPTAVGFAASRQLLLTLGIGTVLAALLVGAIAAYLVNRATRPILAATDAVEKLGQGELFTRIAVTGEDELATLGFNINRMADQIQTLLENQTSEAERARLFAEIATSRTIEGLEAVLARSVKGIREVLNADRIVVYRFNPDWTGYIAAESVLPGWPVALNEQIEDACIGEELLEAYRNGRVVPTNDVFEAGFHPDHLKLMERLQIKANLVTAIVSEGQLFGLLIAHHCLGPYFWQQHEINFLAGAAGQLGLILDRVILLERKKVEAERASLLKDITLRLTQSLDLQNILNTAVESIRQGFGLDRVVVYGLDPVTWKGTVIAESVASGWPQSLGVEIDDACLRQGQVERYRQGQVTRINDVYKEPRVNDCYLKTLSQFAVKANLVAPIVRDNQLFGLLIAHQCDKPRMWQQDEIDVFTQLATQIGVTLDRASLLEKLEQARASAERNSLEQRQQKETLQQRALALLMEVDPVSRGDLTIRANVTEDEIGTVADSYNATIGSLRRIVTQVQTAAQQVAATTNSNEASVQVLSTEASRQAEEISLVLAQIQQMSDSIHAVAANAKQAEAVVRQANQTVEAGDVAMNRTVDGIVAIQETVAETAKKVKRLGESSQKISKVVKLINAFADQTNLLALNAAIEAARAGEQGRGFAVIADEVGTLAQQSQEATAEIEALVAEIQTETQEVVAAMAAGTQQVVTGTQLVDETRSSLNKITAASAQISALVEAIAQTAVVQSQTSETVTQTITGVAAIANKNSTEATMVSASFQELLAVAQELQASVGQFKVS